MSVDGVVFMTDFRVGCWLVLVGTTVLAASLKRSR